MINHKLVSFSAVQIYDISYIHVQYRLIVGEGRRNRERLKWVNELIPQPVGQGMACFPGVRRGGMGVYNDRCISSLYLGASFQVMLPRKNEERLWNGTELNFVFSMKIYRQGIVFGDHKTFADTAYALMAIILREGATSRSIDLVFDVYRETSVKNTEIEKRGGGVSRESSTAEMFSQIIESNNEGSSYRTLRIRSS